jgi:hypothetical protein
VFQRRYSSNIEEDIGSVFPRGMIGVDELLLDKALASRFNFIPRRFGGYFFMLWWVTAWLTWVIGPNGRSAGSNHKSPVRRNPIFSPASHHKVLDHGGSPSRQNRFVMSRFQCRKVILFQWIF